MPYDKYRNWGPDLPYHEGIKKQVIEDLQATEDEIDKLEIVDSFEAYVERQQQNDLAEHVARLATNYVVLPLLSDFLKARMPGSRPISRPRQRPPQ